MALSSYVQGFQKNWKRKLCFSKYLIYARFILLKELQMVRNLQSKHLQKILFLVKKMEKPQ